MNQLELILNPQQAPTRLNDPETSKEAARLVKYGNRLHQVMMALIKMRAATSFECADHLGIPVQNISNCFSRLERLNLCKVVGTAESPDTGRNRQVYSLTGFGLLLFGIKMRTP